ncbi:hypothetical protein L6164_025200 [Bauhinia variegata]|uniref:Uncharacterized protein n=1 Tax=Bauhinia variegata TaxID=167791 RepID=A0ACB9LZX7_BAUVA|nr:hypothetical protein L6164_025200 [Bauhinia variegata]
MVGVEESKDRPAGVAAHGHRTFSRSVSWTDRCPTKATSNLRPPPNGKPRSLLPPLQPLSISKRSVEEWPSAGSDDLGVWPCPQTPRGSATGKAVEISGNSTLTKEFQFKRDKLAFFDKECSRIAEHIYLGSDTVAKNHQLLRQNGITHVLNCVGFVCPEYFKRDFVYKTLWLQDSPTEDITSILYDVFDYFEDVREQGGRVLVHCCQGVSRSNSLVIAYLMWREGQSFEDAFQYVKTARGITNPNMGFACQLLQCQKRVHAMPASPNSMLRMYRMAPHSPYAPLHLVPKMINNPGAQALDSRGAFIIHVPSAIYIWTGKDCTSVMLCNARKAACQVIHYERVTGSTLTVKEGEEPSEFWIALSAEQLISGNGEKEKVNKEGVLCSESMEIDEADTLTNGIGRRKVDDYDLDFEIFHKALSGGVVPPFSESNAGLETCLPARENGWGRLRRKFANGIMKGLITCSKLNCDESCMIIGEQDQEQDSVVDPLPPSPTHPCGSPDSFECFPDNNSDKAKDTFEVPQSPLASTLSPSSSDYASSFTFSPSSTNWSDLSFVSSRQSSPSGLESAEPFYVKDVSFPEESSLLDKEAVPSPSKKFSATYLPCKGYFPSIAERRGSNPPPLMLLSSINESSHVHKNLVRSQSFSLPELEDYNVMKDVSCNQFEYEIENKGKGLISNADINRSENGEPQREINDKDAQARSKGEG